MVEPPLQSLTQSQLNWLSLLKREVEGANVSSINSGQRSSKGFQEAPKASIILDVCIIYYSECVYIYYSECV